MRPLDVRAVPLTVVLLLAACGPSATASPTASPTLEPTASPTPEPTASAAPSLGSSEAAEAYIAAAPDFEMVDLPLQLQDQITEQFASDPNVATIARGFAVATATRDEESIGFILALEIDPSYAALPGFEDDFVTGVSKSAGAEPEPLTLGGRTAYLIEGTDITGVAWVDGTLLAFAFGTEAEPLTALAEALIQANA